MTKNYKKLIDFLAKSIGYNWSREKVSMAKSKSDAKRLIDQNAVSFGTDCGPWNKWPTIHEMPLEHGTIRIGNKPNNLRFLDI